LSVLVALTLVFTFGQQMRASAAITQAASFTADSGANKVSSLTINTTHAAGQFLLAQIVAEDLDLTADVICPPAGWTQIGGTVKNGSNAAQAVFYLAAAAAGGAYTFGFDQTTCSGAPTADGFAAGGIIVYDGVDAANPIVGSASNNGGGSGNSSETITAPTVPAVPAGSKVVRFCGNNKADFGITFSLGTAPVAPTEIYDIGNDAADKPRAAAADADQPLAGEAGTVICGNGGNSASWVAHTVVLRAAPAGPAQCSDNVDNNDPEDTLVDEDDPGCHTDGDPNNPGSYDPNDNDETNGPEGPPGDPTCSDNIDNDGDGLIDQLDPDCQEPEGPPGDPTCSDGVDNDGDGLIDGDDPDCVQPPECSDNVDNNDPEDTLVDEDDPGCHTDGDPNNPGSYDPTDNNETDNAVPECSDNVDNNDAEDTLADEDDPGCHTDGDPNNPGSYDPNDTSEINSPEGPPGDPSCSDGIDNDGDGLIDQLDPGCQSPEGPPNHPSCSDGIDNDGDGLVDLADPDCQPGAGPGFGGGGGGGGVVPPGPTPEEVANPCNNPTIRGTPLNDKIKGTKGADVIDGLGGNDLIKGKKGNDIICGGDGNDRIRGGKGADILFGQGTDDRIRGGKGKESIDGGPGTDRCRPGKGKGSTVTNCERIRNR
jgi:hypothetical protein